MAYADVVSLIVAAHPDDELLGAAEVLLAPHEELGKVIVTYPSIAEVEHVDPRRYIEAVRLLEALGAKCVDTERLLDHPDRIAARMLHVYIPDVTDDHPSHRLAAGAGARIASRAREKSSVFEVTLSAYTIQKRAAWREVRSARMQADVRTLFDTFYPSQRGALADPAYFLFGGVEGLEHLSPLSWEVSIRQCTARVTCCTAAGSWLRRGVTENIPQVPDSPGWRSPMDRAVASIEGSTRTHTAFHLALAIRAELYGATALRVAHRVAPVRVEMDGAVIEL